MIKDVKKPDEALGRDSKMLVDTINTLEACRQHDNVTALFEELCQPSRSAKARALNERYQKHEFAKKAIMR